MERYLIDKALAYLEMKKKRLVGGPELKTLREFVSDTYHKLLINVNFCKIAKEKFPHVTYGTKKGSTTEKKSYPMTFKNYFFKLVKSYYKSDRGIKRMRHAAPTFMVPGGKRCHIHAYDCPEDCQYTTLNRKVLLKSTVNGRRIKEPSTFRSRVWRRREFRHKLNDVLMLRSEQINCTFEPEAGSLSKTIQAALKANPNLQREGYTDEPDPEAYFKKLGKNFESSHPEVYKMGILKRAKLMYMEGKFEDSMNALYQGFNIESIKKRFDPKYMQRFFAEALLKAKK